MNVPIAFEGTSKASIVVYSDVDGLVAEFGGVALTAATFGTLHSLNVVLENPSDQELTISNPGSLPVGVGVITSIWTARHLTMEWPDSWAPLGGTVPFRVSLTEPTGEERLTVELRETGKDGRTPLSFSEMGLGQWAGEVTFPEGGEFWIVATISGERYRLDSTPIWVSSGVALLGEGFDQRLEDADRDGLADALILTPSLIVGKAGTYRVNAKLVDGNGVYLANDGATLDVGVGTHRFDLEFGGPFIEGHKTPGPYELVDLYVFDEKSTGIEERRASLGMTEPYRIDQFEVEEPGQ